MKASPNQRRPTRAGRGSEPIICKRIKADPELCATKIVMVTAKNEGKDEMMGLDIGADDYIMKPFEGTELRHVIKQVLSRDDKCSNIEPKNE